MRAERWQRIEDLYHAALERAASERLAFIAEACAGDEEVRREVESLLASHKQASTFIEKPVAEAAARLFARDQTQAMLGRQISHYKILSLLGTGGMGEVYLAQDTNLGRRVAIKVLLASFSRDEERVRRFQQEARAASALNHPNILTVHEIGQVDGRHFIATEFLEGVTLREYLAGAAVKLEEVLNVGTQVASALAKAHAAGIAHRDIKPENIMVDADGHVKVLDFGLAKQTESQGTDNEAPTRAMVKTDPGVVMGTVSYMSPEQARGLEVDSRTDIWSLGVVLYEMITGHAPFEGPTSSHVIVSILEQQPPPLGDYSEDVPAEMQRIVSLALTKEREGRYQTAKELLGDLRRFKHRLEMTSERRHSLPAEVSDRAPSASSGGLTTLKTGIAAGTDGIPAGRTTSSIEYIVTEITRRKKSAALVLALLVAAAAGIVYGLYRFATRPQPNRTMNITRLTNDGKARNAAISPDGKYVVHSVDEGGQQSLWVRQVATRSNVQIVPPSDVSYYGLTFSKDGNYIYYVMAETSTRGGTLHQIPVLGGASKKLLVNTDTAPSFSPDGKRFAFARGLPEEGVGALIVANADGTGEQKLAERKGSNQFLWPAWSPDGKVIACVRFSMDQAQEGYYGHLIKVNVADGREEPLSSRRWNGIGSLAWLPDGTGLVVAASERVAGSTRQIWQLTYPGGEARRITNDSNRYLEASLSADGNTLVTTQYSVRSNVWVAPNGDASRARQITLTNNDGWQGISWTPDDRIVYESTASGNRDIWIVDAAGSNQKNLTDDAKDDTFPSVSADGRHIVFTSTRAGGLHIWQMDTDGGNPRQLTNGPEENFSGYSADGQWVIYISVGSSWTLWKVPVTGGAPVQLTNTLTTRPVISPDGSLIACYYKEEGGNQRVAIIPFEGGKPIKMLDVPQNSWIRWTPDGRAVAYIKNTGGVSNIWIQPIDGGAPKQLTDFKSDRTFHFAWSRDGKNLALARGVEISDAVLISDFR